jgi:hypothetical protein
LIRPGHPHPGTCYLSRAAHKDIRTKPFLSKIQTKSKPNQNQNPQAKPRVFPYNE